MLETPDPDIFATMPIAHKRDESNQRIIGALTLQPRLIHEDLYGQVNKLYFKMMTILTHLSLIFMIYSPIRLIKMFFEDLLQNESDSLNENVGLPVDSLYP